VLLTILRIIASKGTACSAELARKLGVSPTLTENMLEDLTRLGYLDAVVDNYSTPCDRCPLHTACLFNRRGRIWSLSQKGEQLLRQREKTAI
jgi:predicted ArsR family transcriptional regulator